MPKPEGEYFDPEPYLQQPHKCDKPDPNKTFGERAWRCVCGKAYIRRTESQLNESWYVWERFPKADIKGGIA